MASKKTTGMSGGSNYGGFVCGENSGTVSNNQGSRPVSVQNDVGNINTGDNNQGTMTTGSATPPPDKKYLHSLTVEKLLKHLAEHECSDATMKIFKEKKVTGRVFVDLDDDLLKDLNITDNIEKRKLRSLHAELLGK